MSKALWRIQRVLRPKVFKIASLVLQICSLESETDRVLPCLHTLLSDTLRRLCRRHTLDVGGHVHLCCGKESEVLTMAGETVVCLSILSLLVFVTSDTTIGFFLRSSLGKPQHRLSSGQFNCVSHTDGLLYAFLPKIVSVLFSFKWKKGDFFRVLALSFFVPFFVSRLERKLQDSERLVAGNAAAATNSLPVATVVSISCVLLARPRIVPSTLNCSATALPQGSNLRLRCNDGRGRKRPQRHSYLMRYLWYWRDSPSSTWKEVLA